MHIDRTGVVSSLLHAFPYGNGSIVLRSFALAFAALNTSLFFTFSVMSMARYAIFPDIWRLMVLHPVQSLYLSCVPMGFGTLIVSGAMIEREYSIGKSWVYVLWTAWWIDIVFSVLVCLGLLHIMSVPSIPAHSTQTQDNTGSHGIDTRSSKQLRPGSCQLSRQSSRRQWAMSSRTFSLLIHSPTHCSHRPSRFFSSYLALASSL